MTAQMEKPQAFKVGDRVFRRSGYTWYRGRIVGITGDGKYLVKDRFLDLGGFWSATADQLVKR